MWRDASIMRVVSVTCLASSSYKYLENRWLLFMTTFLHVLHATLKLKSHWMQSSAAPATEASVIQVNDSSRTRSVLQWPRSHAGASQSILKRIWWNFKIKLHLQLWLILTAGGHEWEIQRALVDSWTTSEERLSLQNKHILFDWTDPFWMHNSRQNKTWWDVCL